MQIRDFCFVLKDDIIKANKKGEVICHNQCRHFGTVLILSLNPDNWHLTEDAPEELKKEFAEDMKDKKA